MKICLFFLTFLVLHVVTVRAIRLLPSSEGSIGWLRETGRNLQDATIANYSLPTLPYNLSGLEPVISRQIVDIHYNKHHRGYVNKLNKYIVQLHIAIKAQNLSKILSILPEIKHNGGGHINHVLYWMNLAPISQGGGKLPNPGSPLYEQVQKDWGSFDKLIGYFTNRSVEIKGSGYGWLVWNKVTKRIEYKATKDQKAVYLYHDIVPLLTIDVWEHAYYLDYKNRREAYLESIWKIVNWKVVEERFIAARNETES